MWHRRLSVSSGLLVALGCGTAAPSPESFRYRVPADVCGLEVCPNDDRVDDEHLAACHQLMSEPDDPCRDAFRQLVGCSAAASMCDPSRRLDPTKSAPRVEALCGAPLRDFRACCADHVDAPVCML